MDYEDDLRRHVTYAQKKTANQLCNMSHILNSPIHKDDNNHKKHSILFTPPVSEEKIVIFSAITKNYDSLKIPHNINPTFDYILFSDTPQRETGIWQIKPVPFWNKDSTRITRYVKLHPHVLFSDHTLAIWVDQNVVILDDIHQEIKSFLATNLPIGTFYHPTRHNVQDEALVCIQLHKDNLEILKEQLTHYIQENIPCQELAYTNVMFFNLKHPLLPKILTSWWTELERYSKRDQLSFCFAVAKNSSSWHPLDSKGICAGNHPKFGVFQHDKNHGICASITQSLCDTLKDPFAGKNFYSERQHLLRDVKNIPITICVTFNTTLDSESVQNCLASIADKSHNLQQLIFLISDEIDTDIQQLIQKFSNTHNSTVILHPGKDSYKKDYLTNQIKTNYIILLEGNVIVTNDYSTKMIHALKQSSYAGIVSVLSNNASFQSLPTVDQSNMAFIDLPKNTSEDQMNRLCEVWSVAHVIPRVPLLNPFCLGLTKDTFIALGGFSAFIPNNSFGISDFSFRATELGIDQIIATNTYVYHTKGKKESVSEIPSLQNILETLGKTYGRERVIRSYQTMLFHPVLLELRRRMQYIYNMEDIGEILAHED